MKTVFLILNFKTYKDTIQLTHELLDNNLGERKIVLVDNASPNESFNVLSSEFGNDSRVDVISSGDNGGYAKGNNFGLHYIKKYSPEYVCIINNDVHFSIDTIEKLETQYKKIKDIGFLSPLQFLINEEHPLVFADLCRIPTFMDDILTIANLNFSPQHKYQSNCEYQNLQEVQILPGAFLFINYALFERLGFFEDRTFLFCEERFTAKKVKDAGLRSFLMLDERYIHAHSVTINSETSTERQQRLLFDGKVLYTKLHRKYPLLKISLMYVVFYLRKWLKYVKGLVYGK
ncbi:glycosyltransferase [uncultured Bacteroides sp.]|uniref:glycosyltransferase n=1 Tax=uncultured Bacteroides sp. TaxID=162156 RepID=UPI0025E30139|nr:glycosyltransferase [uncultured Bacteroides sp.]